jgi:erythromycin esterase
VKRRKLVLIIVLLAVISVVGAGVGIHALITRPVGEPQATEITAANLGPQLAKATVLALGEATHGNAEFQQLRRQLLTKLPETHAIVLEEDYGTVARANAFVQGGEGTPEQAARQLGFAINRTQEMAELLGWLRRHNEDRPSDQRIELIGMDVQRYVASKELALAALHDMDSELAERLTTDLEVLTDDPAGPTDGAGRAARAVDQLIDALDRTDQTRLQARNAALALRQGIALDTAGADYAAKRAKIMFENLRRTVSEQAARGNGHILVVAHNGHVDKVSAAFGHADLGELASREWGEAYQVIGTEFVRSTFVSGERGRRWKVTMNHQTPLRGMFDGTAIGFLDFERANQTNRRVLGRPVRMASAGESFHRWQARIWLLNSVKMVPEDSYDALILVDRATPVMPL